MPRVCTICTHEARAEIDAELVQSAPKRKIAARFGVAESSLRRHAEAHLSRLLALAAEAAEVSRADDLLGDARRIQAETLAILVAAKAGGDAKTALVALEGLRRGLALLVGLLERMAGAPGALVISWEGEQRCRRCGFDPEQPEPKPVEGAAELSRLPANVRPLRPITGAERGPA